MKPFDNNTPRLSASERIRNKRDATIYQAEKQRFQNKKTCGNKNVKYYNNGAVRSIKSYKLQKSLARGNVLCEDCDDKGLLCGGVANHDALASIRMGNNIVSEYWGGGAVFGERKQSPGFDVIQSDVSGVWDPSANDYKGNICLTPTDCSYGYIDNLIHVPRNLDGRGVVIDPSNQLFPDELCEPFRYLKHSQLKTYLVISTILPYKPGDSDFYTCNDIAFSVPPPYNSATGGTSLIGSFLSVGKDNDDGSENWLSGEIKSICCKGTIYTVPAVGTSVKECGFFDLYVELLNINSYDKLNGMLLSPKNRYDPSILDYQRFGLPDLRVRFYKWWLIILRPWLIESFSIIQGTIPPSLNQTKYNATRQSYMSCLENGTRKINFTKNTKKEDNVIASYCKVLDASGNS